MDHAGYFTRSVIDAAVLLEALAGHDENDPTSSKIMLKNIQKPYKFQSKISNCSYKRNN